MPYYLLKYFSKQKYLREFIRGNLYMNTLHFFWDEDTFNDTKKRRDQYISSHPGINPDTVTSQPKRLPEQQEDVLEGVIGLSSTDESLKDFNGYNLTGALYRSKGMGYCNTLCFYKLYYDLVPVMGGKPFIHYTTTSVMNDFGDYVAFILNPDELARRIEAAVNREGYKDLIGSVRYHQLKYNGECSKIYNQGSILLKTEEEFDLKDAAHSIVYRRDCFDKTDKYKCQNEWRVALYRGKKETEAYTLEVGDLSDVIYWDRTENLNSGIYNALSKGMKSIPDNAPRFRGNINRKELWNKFFELGDYKATKMMFIG